MAVELRTTPSLLSPFPEEVSYKPQVKNLEHTPRDKVKCLSGRVLSHWAANRSSTQDQILIWRIICAAGRYLGAATTSVIFGFLGSLWHTAAAVVNAAAFLIAGLIYLPTRLFNKSDDPKADWQVSLEKFTMRCGENALKHFGSAYVDMIRCTGLGTLFTAFHFAASPEDYQPNRFHNLSSKPSYVDTAIPVLLYWIFRN